MRLLLVNPNMTAIARGVAGSAAEVVPLTCPRGFPYIATRAEAQVAGGIVLEMIAENLPGADAVIMAAFGDPACAARASCSTCPWSAWPKRR